MRWSRYNLLFLSERNGWLLYNSASNSFLKLSEEAALAVKKLETDADNFPYDSMPEVYFHLRNGGFIVEDSRDDDFFNILKMRRLTASYAGSALSLTIAPSLACNFGCPYCYEENRQAVCMDEETEDKLIEFIEKQRHIRKVSVSWYGGEPLLVFDKIKRLTEKITKTGKDYSAFIVTNGYCLTKDVADQLADLKINSMQITLDGKKEIHDSRRFLIGGGKTYEKIVENIDYLMKSEWDGSLNVRVNVDPENREDFADVYRFIQDRYPEKFGKKLNVYPGFVHTDEPHPDTNCFFDSYLKGQFLVDLYREYGINALSVFPHMVIGGCTLTRRNSYVVGPKGELYKCWNDVGCKEEEIGYVNAFTNWNMSLVAEGMVAASFMDDEECKKCFFFPICDGGCAKMRMLNKRDNGNRDTCSYFKSHIKELLELYYEHKEGAK